MSVAAWVGVALALDVALAILVGKTLKRCGR